MSEIKNVGVVGAGTMGNGIAHVFARSGYQVLLCDVEQRFLDRGLAPSRPTWSAKSRRARQRPNKCKQRSAPSAERSIARTWPGATS